MGEPINRPVSATGCLLRLYWIFGGNAVLLFLFVFIIDRHFQFPSWLDLGYWITVITLVAARYIDVSQMQGETAEGKPATMKDFRTYSLIVISVSALAWTLAFFIR